MYVDTVCSIVDYNNDLYLRLVIINSVTATPKKHFANLKNAYHQDDLEDFRYPLEIQSIRSHSYEANIDSVVLPRNYQHFQEAGRNRNV